MGCFNTGVKIVIQDLLLNVNHNLCDTSTFTFYSDVVYNSSRFIVHFIVPTGSPVANAGSDITLCNGKKEELKGSGGDFFKWSIISNIKEIK